MEGKGNSESIKKTTKQLTSIYFSPKWFLDY